MIENFEAVESTKYIYEHEEIAITVLSEITAGELLIALLLTLLLTFNIIKFFFSWIWKGDN